jgi:SlyX protein
MDPKIEDLQTRISYQEDSINELSKQSHQQQLELDSLKSELKQLRDLLYELKPSPLGEDTNELPPHY